MALLPVAIIAMCLALGLYSVGVWSEKIAGWLKPWHLACFVTGFIFDTTGTTIMSQIAGNFQFNIHGITGAMAILLMLGHAVWAGVVLWMKQDSLRSNFHKFSLAVWAIWLVPFISGMVIANVH